MLFVGQGRVELLGHSECPQYYRYFTFSWFKVLIFHQFYVGDLRTSFSHDSI